MIHLSSSAETTVLRNEAIALYYYHTKATLCGARPSVLNENKNWVIEYIKPLECDLKKLGSIHEWLLPFQIIKAEHTLNKAILLTYLYPHNYFHWWVDSLARLALVKNEVKLEEYVFIINSPLNKFQAESLELLLGFKPNLFIRNNIKLEVDNLIVISPIRTKSAFSSFGLMRLRSAIYSCIQPIEYSYPRRIFILRSELAGRNIINMNELYPVLQAFNIQTIHLEHMAVRQQISLFRQAELVIAVHGAALTNIIFSERVKIIEIFGSFAHQLYGQIARALDFPYQSVHATGVSSTDKNADMRIDFHQLEKAILSYDHHDM
jgi:capsular polysaccharide biosynthesis protein